MDERETAYPRSGVAFLLVMMFIAVVAIVAIRVELSAIRASTMRLVEQAKTLPVLKP